jgi:probable HAF family extracellular repeat protein
MAVTPDGAYVTGIADILTDEQWGDRAFRWTAPPNATLPGTLISLGTPTGLPWTAGNSISPEGNAVAGNAANRAFRWTTSGGMQNLGTLPGGTLALAYGVSSNGGVVVGMSNSPTGSWAFRWTPAGGMQNLGALPGGNGSTALGISPDGTVIVGSSAWAGSGTRAFRWTASGGFQNLGALPGSGNSWARAVNAHGDHIAGESEWGGGRHLVLWSGSGSTMTLQHIGPPPGATESWARAINVSGQVVVGGARVGSATRAMMWSSRDGLMDLNVYLPLLGTSLTGWVLEEATGVDASGSVIVGYGTYNGQQRGFYVRGVPCPTFPAFLSGPDDATVCAGGDLTLTTTFYSPIPTIRQYWFWYHSSGWAPVTEGSNGGRFTVDPGGAHSPTLTIRGVTAGSDLVFISSLDGICTDYVASRTATVRVCVADTNCDGIVDFNDFLEYLNLYNAQDPRADLNGDEVVDFNDLLVFMNLYNTGC